MRRALEVADVFCHHGAAYREAHAGHLNRGPRGVMGTIETCRSAALGGHVEQCNDCGRLRIAYNFCRNRLCPKCQGLARAQWLADRQSELLPVPYFHLVFTVPAPIAEIALHNKAVVYGILFTAAAETLRIIAADPRHLGAEIGLVAVLQACGPRRRKFGSPSKASVADWIAICARSASVRVTRRNLSVLVPMTPSTQLPGTSDLTVSTRTGLLNCGPVRIWPSSGNMAPRAVSLPDSPIMRVSRRNGKAGAGSPNHLLGNDYHVF